MMQSPTSTRAPEYVLDASAVMALLNRERGWEVVDSVLGRCVISTVNWAEIMSLLMTGRGRVDVVEGRDVLIRRGLVTTDFTRPESEISGILAPATRPYNISLADRACLSLGLALDLPVLTADREWLRFDAGVEVRLVRG